MIRLYHLSKQIYDAAMSEHLGTVFDKHSKTDEKKESLKRDEALDYVYDVLGVVKQGKELAIAKAAAKIAGSGDEVVDKSEMERFLFDLFTNQLDSNEYKTDSELGINVKLQA